MTPEIERLAKEAGLTDPDLGPWMIDYGNAEDAIRKFADLLAEECAKVCEMVVREYRGNQVYGAALCADYIRAKFALSGGEEK